MSGTKKMIWKASGEHVPFSKAHVEKSLRRSGASSALAQEITLAVEKQIGSKTTTSDIYQFAYALLKKKKDLGVAGRYSLKKAIMELGPSGFPFERFVGAIVQQQGFRIEVGVMMDGKCVRHEVDVVAHKLNEHRLMECKFHIRTGISTDVKVPLYIHSRFEDIENYKNNKMKYKHYVVTNTHFSKDAIQYGECIGMNLIGWRYPKSGGLERWVEDSGLHPITVLSTLQQKEKQILLEYGIVMCKDLINNGYIQSILKLKQGRVDDIEKEAKEICSVV